MHNRRLDELRLALTRCLGDEAGSAQQSVLDFVRTVDLAYDQVGGDDPQERQWEAFLRSILARATVATGAMLGADRRAATIDRTVTAAEEYLRSETDERWDEVLQAATDSFPFGPGDGCLAVPELGGHGARGSGDHGSGFIWFVAEMVGPERIRDALATALIPWLSGAQPGRDNPPSPLSGGSTA